MGHFDPLPAKARGHFPFKGANENLTRNLHTCYLIFENVVTFIEH